ncbi:hypothetical protein QFC24_003431 [Naganishia onofrii]|uniref:Uncharacterized protein n=1 Tax=Naganishia onofrii TaxID=1851511 RepID=A0ACC2XJU6_9TREE|nr:hypothetical protein QFC24_003431 [Naganishia onofrii]
MFNRARLAINADNGRLQVKDGKVIIAGQNMSEIYYLMNDLVNALDGEDTQPIQDAYALISAYLGDESRKSDSAVLGFFEEHVFAPLVSRTDEAMPGTSSQQPFGATFQMSAGRKAALKKAMLTCQTLDLTNESVTEPRPGRGSSRDSNNLNDILKKVGDLSLVETAPQSGLSDTFEGLEADMEKARERGFLRRVSNKPRPKGPKKHPKPAGSISGSGIAKSTTKKSQPSPASLSHAQALERTLEESFAQFSLSQAKDLSLGPNTGMNTGDDSKTLSFSNLFSHLAPASQEQGAIGGSSKTAGPEFKDDYEMQM